MSYILIVDDEQVMADAIADMLDLLDWKTVIANRPGAAIREILKNPPALIFLDMNMPGVDGLEVCRYIKRDPIMGMIPVIFITAEDDPGIQKAALDAGASAYIIKPMEFEHLEDILSKFVKSNSS